MTEEKTQSDTLGEAYRDRNLAVMALALLAGAAGYRAGIKQNPNDPLWPIIFIDLPTGQVSWHLPHWEAVEAALPAYDGEWDGHTLAEKQARLVAFIGGAA